VSDRLAAGAYATTIDRSLEVVRTILNRAARSYGDADGRPWLKAISPLISMLAKSPPPPLSHNVEGTGPALSQTTHSLGPHGAIRREHRPA
jgi:hypothetical protein